MIAERYRNVLHVLLKIGLVHGAGITAQRQNRLFLRFGPQALAFHVRANAFERADPEIVQRQERQKDQNEQADDRSQFASARGAKSGRCPPALRR